MCSSSTFIEVLSRDNDISSLTFVSIFQLQSKREQFFKNELPPPSSATTGGGTTLPSQQPQPPASGTPPVISTTSAIKEALAKRVERITENHIGGSDVPDNKERYNKTEKDKVPERRTKELDGYVGFANLPNQVYRKAVKKGFDFTLMVVGKFLNSVIFVNIL
jgi:septin 7